jgi:hypothetical protein
MYGGIVKYRAMSRFFLICLDALVSLGTGHWTWQFGICLHLACHAAVQPSKTFVYPCLHRPRRADIVGTSVSTIQFNPSPDQRELWVPTLECFVTKYIKNRLLERCWRLWEGLFLRNARVHIYYPNIILTCSHGRTGLVWILSLTDSFDTETLGLHCRVHSLDIRYWTLSLTVLFELGYPRSIIGSLRTYV